MNAPRTIVIQPYDARWPEEFASLAEPLRNALGPLAVSVDHIGSTSVPGLAAKDICDVQITVADLDDPRLTAAYEQVKVALARLHPHDVGAYYDVKDPVCDLIMDAAERWAAATRWLD